MQDDGSYVDSDPSSKDASVVLRPRAEDTEQNSTPNEGHCNGSDGQCTNVDSTLTEVDCEKQENSAHVVLTVEEDSTDLNHNANLVMNPASRTIVVPGGESSTTAAPPIKENLSRATSSHDQCRVCQQENEEDLIDLGCKCKGDLAKAHHSCINAWFQTRGSNKCEICQEIAVNVSVPESQPSTSYWIWRMDSNIRPRDNNRGCFSPLWVAFSILIGGLLLDVLISITLGVSALPVNIIIGVIVVLGLGTALRLGLEFCHEWRVRRVVQRVDATVNLGYHPTL